jgi:hypothetical protein
VTEYNQVKLAWRGRGAAEYERRKSEFFDALLELWAVHPAGGASSGPPDEPLHSPRTTG